MKSTLSMLAALLVSTLALNAASAQQPYPIQPMGYGHPGYAPAYAMGSMQAGQAVGGQTGGSNCGQAGCNSCGGKHGLFKSDGGCGTGCGNGCGGGLCAKLKSCFCKSKPSNAPVLRGNEYPLGFPNHPYVRSPRDYFMYDPK